MNNEIGTEIIANKDNKNIPQIKGDNKYHKKNKPTKNRNIDIGIDKIRHCSHCLIVRGTQHCFLKKNAIIKNDINKKINIVEKIQINASVAQRANAVHGILKKSKQDKIFLKRYILMKNFYLMILRANHDPKTVLMIHIVQKYQNIIINESGGILFSMTPDI